jgi:hypothetical protein
MGRRCTQIRPIKRLRFFGAEKISMIYGYAWISTDGQSVTAQVGGAAETWAGKVFHEVASGAKTDRPQLRRFAGRDQRWRRGDGDTARPAGTLDA